MKSTFPRTVLVATILLGLSLPAGAESYAWRGFHFDEARHFFGKATVKDYLDHMHRLGLNRFHWHLADDQGWRLDVPGFPELVKYGAVRSSTPVPGTEDESDGKSDADHGGGDCTPDFLIK